MPWDNRLRVAAESVAPFWDSEVWTKRAPFRSAISALAEVRSCLWEMMESTMMMAEYSGIRQRKVVRRVDLPLLPEAPWTMKVALEVFLNDTASPKTYSLSLNNAFPI